MKSLKHVLRSGLLLLGLCFSVFSCDMFQHSIPQYLKNYTEQILAGEITPCSGMPFERASDGTYIIPSTLDEDYCFSFYYNDTQDRPYIKLCYINPSSPNTSNDFPTYALDEEYYAILDRDKSFCKLCFKPSYLKSKDLESGERNIKFTLLFKYSFSPDFINPDANGIESMYFDFNCIVNTKPDILEDEMKAAKGTFTDNKKNILCFNIKPEVQNLYDDLKNADGKYQINIDGKNYEFTFEGGKPVFTDTEHFFYSQSTITGLSGNLEFENIFEEGQNPVYFVTNDNAERDYTILVTDAHGLKSPYKISTKPSGHQSLELISTQYSDYLQITPKFVTIPAKPGENPLTLNKVTLVYSINNEEQQTHDFTTSDPFKIYVPGGTTSIYYYMKAQAQDVNTSQAKTATFTKDNKMYASASPKDSSYKGGSSGTPTTVKDALDYICHQSGEWNLYLEQGEYMAAQDDISNEDSVQTFIYLKKKNGNQNIKINIQGEGNNKRATFNANQLGRVLYANGIEVSLKYVNITGGKITHNGGGICANTPLVLDHCDIYGNTAEGSSTGNGGGIYKNYTDITLKDCKIYGNTARQGAGICVAASDTEIPYLTLQDSQVYNNKATQNGGGIYNYRSKILISGTTIIGSASDETAQYTETSNKYSNRAGSNGGGIYTVGDTQNKRLAEIYIGYYRDNNQIKKENNFTGSIKYNTANYGGGIYCINSIVKMNNGSITRNFAHITGGGINIESGTTDTPSKVYIENLLMTENNVDADNSNAKGGAVYITSDNTQFTPIGNIRIASTGAKLNDIYLNSAPITLLEDEDLSSSSYMTITPSDYSIATTANPKMNAICEDSDDVPDVLAANYKYISVTPNNGTNYFLSPKAKLTQYQPAETLTSDPSSSDKIGAFSASDIKNIAALVENGTSDFSGVTITLQEDLTLNRNNYDPIGKKDSDGNLPFKGTFDGNGKTITFDGCNVALFRYTMGATIKNIKIAGTFTGISDMYQAPIIQFMYGGTLKDCRSTCNITVSSGNTVAGFVAFAYGSEVTTINTYDYYSRACLIDGCINEGYIDAPNTPYAGGIAGSAKVCEIRNCAQKNYVKGKDYVGGIAAKIDGKGLDGKGTIIENSYVTGNITATEGIQLNQGLTIHAGGIAGYYTYTDSDQTPTIRNVYFWGFITIPTVNGVNNFQRGAILGVNCNETYHPILYDIYYKASDYYFECGSYSLENGEVHRVDGDVSFYLNNFNNFVSNNNGSSNKYKNWAVDGNYLKFSDES